MNSQLLFHISLNLTRVWSNLVLFGGGVFIHIFLFQQFMLSLRFYNISGLDINGCPLGNSKFTLQSDNLNICLWLSACQVEKIYQNPIQIDTSVYNPTSDLDIIYDLNQFFQNCFGSFLKQNSFLLGPNLLPP